MQARTNKTGKSQRQDKQQAQQRYAITALCAVASALFIGCCVLLFQTQAGALKTRADYSTTKLTVGTYSNIIECAGTVDPIRTSSIELPSNSTVSALYVKDGDHVDEGDYLFEVTENKASKSGKAKKEIIKADISGRIANTRIQVDTGADDLGDDYALQIIDRNVLVGHIEVPEYAVSLIKVGQQVVVAAPDVPNRSYSGIISAFASKPSKVSAQVGRTTYQATLLFDSTYRLQTGMEVLAQIPIADYGQVYYVPAAAVGMDGEFAYVAIVYANGTIEQHQVQLIGMSEDGQRIIKGDALADGSTIRADLSE